MLNLRIKNEIQSIAGFHSLRNSNLKFLVGVYIFGRGRGLELLYGQLYHIGLLLLLDGVLLALWIILKVNAK